jgi:ubiquinone/menaquinone biosynthesis C-methylase UbiE
MPRKDKHITPSVTEKLQDLGYRVADWDDSKSKLHKEVEMVLSTASKNRKGNVGIPDRIYCKEKNKLLILVEEKPSIKDHDNPNSEKGAISGIKWYLSRFLDNKYFYSWKILGIAVSGDLSQEYNHKFNCYMIYYKVGKITALVQVTNFMTEKQFLALFNTLDEEKAVTAISGSSKKINNLLRSVDSQKRPVLLSSLMICLHRTDDNNFPDHYEAFSPDELVDNVAITSNRVLKNEGISEEKLKILKNELAFLSTDDNLRKSTILKDILTELQTTVIPLFEDSFSTHSNYDIIGKFYEEFLKYAGVSNVKKGIILTPRHITTLFTKLVDLKDDDKIVDICCGTGAFLIAGMNELVNKIKNSNRMDKHDAIQNVKEKQLLGFENNSTMYICAVSNMLFRGDGKSSIHYYDSIRDERVQTELDKFGATIGFINPPYSGRESKDDPTPKEITFLTKLLDNCSRYAVIIAPLSTYFKDEAIRDNILKKHTLLYVINMPKDLFQPNASTHTAIAVFKTNKAFDYEKDEVIFYDLRDDGFVLSKNRGRTDIYNKWPSIEEELLNSIKLKVKPDNVRLVYTRIKSYDEWTVYAHSKTDYSTLCEDDFIKSVADYMLFKAKMSMDLIDKNLTEAELLEAISKYYND